MKKNIIKPPKKQLSQTYTYNEIDAIEKAANAQKRSIASYVLYAVYNQLRADGVEIKCGAKNL